MTTPADGEAAAPSPVVPEARSEPALSADGITLSRSSLRRVTDRLRPVRPQALLLLALLVGIAARLILAPISADPDLESFAEASLGILYGSAPYATGLVYPPAWVLVLTLVGRTAVEFSSAPSLVQIVPSLTTLGLVAGANGVPPGLASPGFAIVEKLPLFLFDLFTGAILYQMVLERTGRGSMAQVAFATWFLNPLVILESAVHGAFDVIPVFFSVLAIYCIPRGMVLTGGAALGLAASLKVFPLLLLPLFLALLIRTGERRLGPVLRREVVFGVGLAAGILVSSWPPTLFNGFVDRVITPQGGPLNVLPAYFGGFGPFAFLTLPGLGGVQATLAAHATGVFLALVLVALAVLLFLAYRLARGTGPVADSELWRMAGLSAMAVLLAFPYVQPQYLLWGLPFLVLLAVTSRKDAALLWAATAFASAYVLLSIAGPFYSFVPLYYLPPRMPSPGVLSSLLEWFRFAPWVGFLTTVPAVLLLALLLRRIALRPTSKGSPT